MADIQETTTVEKKDDKKHGNGWGFTPWHLAPLVILALAILLGYAK